MQYNDPPQNPFDPSVPDYEPQTLPMDEIIRRAVQAGLLGARVALPCMVVAKYSSQKVDLQPLLQTRYIDGEVKSLPPIRSVPISMPQGANYFIKLPVDVNDTGYAVFSDRSLEAWLAGDGSITDPQDSRIHDLNDAIFVPGLVPFSKQIADNSTDMILKNGQAQVNIERAGKYKIANSENELMNLLVQITTQVQELAATLSTDTVNTIFGPMQLNAFSTYQDIGNQLEELLNKLETLQG